MRNAGLKRLANLGAVKLEPSDVLAESGNKHSITFLFTNYGHIDGLDFVTHCATSIQFAFQSEGNTVPSTKIIIGAGKVHPAGDPFTVTRIPPPTTTAAATTTAATTTT